MEGYETIPDSVGDKIDINTGIESAKNPLNSTNEYDENHPALIGSNIDLKFINKSRYESKFVWISPRKKTIHMSDYNTKERRHKEASLSEVTSLVAGPPLKSKVSSNDPSIGKKCLTINFQKGGGIDLKFENESERDNWYALLNRIVLNQIKFNPTSKNEDSYEGKAAME